MNARTGDDALATVAALDDSARAAESACPLCRADLSGYTRPIITCPGCGLRLERPVPRQDADGRAMDRRTMARGVREIGKYLDQIERHSDKRDPRRRGAPLLGIGRDLEALVPEATRRGYVASSVDEVHRQEGGDFDIVMLLGVLAETANPVSQVERAWQLLRTGGCIFVEAPVGGHSPSGQFFDRHNLESLLVLCGFEHVRIARGSRGQTLTAVGSKSQAGPLTRRNARLSVVMPVFNERTTFSSTAERVLDNQIAGVDLELVIVESNSTDGTREDVRRFERHPNVRVLYEERPRGKGYAVRQGLAHATGDFVLIQDADDEYDVSDYAVLLDPLRKFQRAFVLGSRHGARGGSWLMRDFTGQPGLSAVMNVAHLTFTALFNVVYGTSLRDPFTMYKVFRRDCLSGLTFDACRFDFDWEIVGKLVRAGYEPVEIPVRYRSRSYRDGKKVRFWRDPLTWIVACFKYRFVPLGK